MNGPPPPRGLRILIVEDEENTVRILTYELLKALPEAAIDSGATVAEGESKLRESLETGRPYDVAILDFKLPSEYRGQNPEPDHSLGLRFRDESPQTLIIHVTAYKDDPGFKGYLRYQNAPSEMGRMFVPKESGWMQMLPKEIIRGIPSYRIRRRFDGLYRHRRTFQLQRSGPRCWAIGRSNRARSLAVAELCADASQHWVYLSESLKNDLKRTLGYAKDDKGNHYVGVVETETKEQTADTEEEL